MLMAILTILLLMSGHPLLQSIGLVIFVYGIAQNLSTQR